jgi:hypothetical protein
MAISGPTLRIFFSYPVTSLTCSACSSRTSLRLSPQQATGERNPMSLLRTGLEPDLPRPPFPLPSRSGGPHLGFWADMSALRFSPCRAAPLDVHRNPGRNMLIRAPTGKTPTVGCTWNAMRPSPSKTPLVLRGWGCASIRRGCDQAAEWQSLPTRVFELFHVLGDMSISSIFNGPQDRVPWARVSCMGMEGRGDRRIGGQPHDGQLQEAQVPCMQEAVGDAGLLLPLMFLRAVA